MIIVTDRACDLSPSQLVGLKVHFTPMRLTLDGKTYSSGEDLSSEQFYEILAHTDGLPVTSQATPGDFAEIYRRLAQTDPEILSIHISSNLSGTIQSATIGAEMVPEARVTIWDSRTLSCPLAWQVEAAGLAINAGWPLERILAVLERVRSAAEGLFTLDTLKYLIHGGRIGHLKGLLASVLHIRPIIGITKDTGIYYTLAQERTMKRALQKVAESLLRFFPEGSDLRAQLLNGYNPQALADLQVEVEKLFKCHWLPTISVGPILGAHTGPSVVGLCAAPFELFGELSLK